MPRFGPIGSETIGNMTGANAKIPRCGAAEEWYSICGENLESGNERKIQSGHSSASIPESMKAAVIDRFREPDVLSLHTVPTPQAGQGIDDALGLRAGKSVIIQADRAASARWRFSLRS